MSTTDNGEKSGWSVGQGAADHLTRNQAHNAPAEWRAQSGFTKQLQDLTAKSPHVPASERAKVNPMRVARVKSSVKLPRKRIPPLVWLLIGLALLSIYMTIG